MAFFGLRFDLRNPPLAGTTMAERYRAALDMAQWADERGFVVVVLSEHHGSDDGYLPSALTMAAAIAARTSQLRIRIAAVVASFHDPLRLAEEAAVVDQISAGRLDLVVTNGYVPEEFAMFDVGLSERVARTTEAVATLRAAGTGEPFEFRGRTVRVTPPAFGPGGVAVELGGSTQAAARRAARLGVGFMPTDGNVWEHYRAAVIELGRPDPGGYLGGDTGFRHLAKDVETGWEQIGTYALHEANAYGAWREAGDGGDTGYRRFPDVEAVRASGQYRVQTPDELAADLAAAGPFAFAIFHPLMGGIPPAVAWESLRLVDTEVMPRLAAGAD